MYRVRSGAYHYSSMIYVDCCMYSTYQVHGVVHGDLQFIVYPTNLGHTMTTSVPAPRPKWFQATSLIEAGLSSQVLFPSSDEYHERQSSYWSKCAKRLQPACIVQPRTAEEVASAVKALVAVRQQFAVRSGGHTHWTGSNNIGEGGVTIDLSLLSFTIYHGKTDTVEIGPGGRWRDVYEELHQYGRVVAGYVAFSVYKKILFKTLIMYPIRGREGNVGVAGFLLGGGLTFFTGQ